VHFHVIPRYAGQRRFADTVTRDAGWPGPPELGRINDLDDTQRDALRRHLISLWG
jgi:diadenosine tetraphosphate (Ap4A) HIT family hydrolase